jgi:hypothetical protein
MVAGSRPTSGPAVVFGGSPAEPPQLSRGAQARNSQAGRYQEKNDGPLGNSDRSGGFRIVEGKTVGCAPAPVVESRNACDPGIDPPAQFRNRQHKPACRSHLREFVADEGAFRHEVLPRRLLSEKRR